MCAGRFVSQEAGGRLAIVEKMKQQIQRLQEELSVEKSVSRMNLERLSESCKRESELRARCEELEEKVAILQQGLGLDKLPFLAKHAANQKEDIRTRIERLRGLRPPLKDLPTYDATRLRQRALTREGIEAALTRQVLQEQLVHA